MIEQKWIILGIFVLAFIIIFDEFAYKYWKVLNPGFIYTGVRDRNFGLVDPNLPPTIYVYE